MHPVLLCDADIFWNRVKCISILSLNTSLKTSIVVHVPSQKSNNQCLCSRSNSICINACGHLHTSIQWEYVIEISNHRISCWIQLVGSSNCAISEVQRFSLKENQMSVISVPDIIVHRNLSLEQRITLLSLVSTSVFLFAYR